MKLRQLHRIENQLAKPVPLARGQHVRRVLAGGHGRHPKPQLSTSRHALGAQHRRMPGAIGVKGKHHLLRVPGKLLQLVRSDRRPHHGDGLLDSGLVRRQHIRISLHDHRAPHLRDRRASPIDAVERAALAVELPLRRVQVLGLRVGAQRPRAESLNAPARIAYRKHDAGTKPVVLAALPALLHETGRGELLHAEPRPLPAHEHLIPGTWRITDTESPQHLPAEPTGFEVLARFPSLGVVAQVIRIEAGGPLQQLPEPSPSPPRLLGPRVLALALDLHAVALAERLDRLRKAQPLLLLHEAEHVPPGLAPEAVIELLPRIHRERRRALLVERAQPREPVTGAAQVRIRRDDLDDVRGILHALDRLVRELAQRRLSSGSAIRLKAAMQNRSVIPAM